MDSKNLFRLNTNIAKIPDIAKFCRIPGKILNKSILANYSCYNEPGYNEEKRTDLESLRLR